MGVDKNLVAPPESVDKKLLVSPIDHYQNAVVKCTDPFGSVDIMLNVVNLLTHQYEEMHFVGE